MESPALQSRCSKRTKYFRKLHTGEVSQYKSFEIFNIEATCTTVAAEEKMVESISTTGESFRVEAIDPGDLHPDYRDLEHCYSRSREEEPIVTSVESDVLTTSKISNCLNSEGEVSQQMVDPEVKMKERMAYLRNRKKIKSEKKSYFRKKNTSRLLFKTKKELIEKEEILEESKNIQVTNLEKINTETPNTKMFTKSRVIRYVCPVCGTFLISKTRVVDHAKREHDEVFKIYQITKKYCYIYQCTKCDESTYELTSIKKHFESHSYLKGNFQILPFCDSRQNNPNPNSAVLESNLESQTTKTGKSESSKVKKVKNTNIGSTNSVFDDDNIDVESYMSVTMTVDEKNVIPNNTSQLCLPPPTSKAKFCFVTKVGNASTDTSQKCNTYHKNGQLIINKSAVLKCTNCESQFTSHVDISRHFMKMHMSNVKYPSNNCFYCSISFRSQGQLENHLKYHDYPISK